MSRIALLLVMGLLLVGCSQPEDGTDQDAGGGEQAVRQREGGTAVDLADSAADSQDADAAEVASTEGMGDEADRREGDSNADPTSTQPAETERAEIEPAETEPAETESAETEPVTAADRLRELQQRSASNAEYFEFVEAHPSTAEAFQALQRIARQNATGEARARLIRLLNQQFVQNESVDDTIGLQAAVMSLGMSSPEARKPLAADIAKRFVTSREQLDDVAMRALSTLMRSGSSEVTGELLNGLGDRFADDEGITRVVQMFERAVPQPEVEAFFRQLAENSSVDKVKGMAMMSLAKYYAGLPEYKSFIDDDRFISQFPDSVAYIRDFQPADHAEEIESLLNRVVADFADVKAGRGSTLGKLAENELFVLNHLSVGREAPDIEGEDLDGEVFKLSDYRGKVVMLDFWGDW